MAIHGYMTVTGKSQGLISAGCSTVDSIGNKCQMGHTDEIMVLSYEHRMSNIDNSHRATHRPIVITKNIDKSTALLAQALANRESLDCKIALYRIAPNGGQEKFFSVEIEGCMLADIATIMPHALMQSEVEAQEHVAIRYRDIRWTHHIAGTSGYAFWGDTE